MVKVWIDCDMGYDDLVAVLMLASAPEIEIAGLSLVAGNAPLPQVIENTQNAAAFFSWDFPLFAGRDRPVLGPLETAGYVLGDTGIRTSGRSLPATTRRPMGHAVNGMVDFIEENPGATILALGPLSNLAGLLLVRPDLAEQIGRLVWMGGSLGPGNHSAAAEYNAAADPVAVQMVLESGVAFAMVGLDACRQVSLIAADLAVLRGKAGEKAQMLADLTQGYLAIASADLSKPMSWYDPTAAAAVLDPACIEWRPAHITMETGEGPARGMTVVETRVPPHASPRKQVNAQVAGTVEAQKVRTLIARALEASC
ncbi:nucleoside hydrolase [Lacibacterium aquatile]|uniref:Nucleoside hydrolase n=1 Tax=Lacibacterium aquatile TaxID=1168082 RepID=A0ABW5DQ45_9PROT